jgi:hypothetical protein
MAWTKVVREYTLLGLTVPEDRLAALSGLAEIRHSSINDQYIAGMWREHLKYQLLWKVLFKGPALKSYIAPSWSWASVTGAIHYPYQNVDIGTWKILDIKCHPKVEDTFGDCMVGAHLVIEGPLVPVKLVECYEGWRIKPKEDKDPKGPKLTPDWDSEDRRHVAVEQGNEVTYFFLMVSQAPAPPQGLLLKARESQSPPTYERLAYICAQSPTRRRTWSDESSDSEDEVYRDGYHWRVWKLFIEQQVFTVY